MCHIHRYAVFNSWFCYLKGTEAWNFPFTYESTNLKQKVMIFLYVQCYSCTQRLKTKILTTRALPSWIEFDVVTSQCCWLCNATWIDYMRLSNDFSGFYKRSINAGTWKSTITSHIQDVAFEGVTSQRQTQSKMAAP